LSAENGALPNGKVGGVGDVIRDLPVALANRGWRSIVMTPSYGMFTSLPGATQLASLAVRFGGATETVELSEVPGPDPRVRHYILDHAFFSPHGSGLIYCDDTEEPFATDASKFAFFCAAAATAINAGAVKAPRIIHLHDWQTALFLVLREYDPSFASLKKIPTVFTIHNLAFQGIRPLSGGRSSLRTWFPDLLVEHAKIADPRWVDCLNPMAAGIRLATRVNTVSPQYAREILRPNDPAGGYFGGEGLEQDLTEAQSSGRLFGVLNGCSYESPRPRRPGWSNMLDTMRAELGRWIARESPMASAHYIADKQLSKLSARRPGAILTSVGRVGAQKTQLFREQVEDGVSALEAVLKVLGKNGLFIIQGSGDSEYEKFLASVAATHTNLVFLRGYSDRLARMLYSGGDLFLMPSSFEPCGISQMLAMRAGQLCVVHGVGGLRDTVTDNINGFVFEGATLKEQARHFVAKVGQALEMRETSAAQWKKMGRSAAAVRFSWDATAAAYEKDLYDIDGA
jgi:starch synthase